MPPKTPEQDVADRVRDLLAACDPGSTSRLDFLNARFDAGLAWVHYPVGDGGLGIDRELQPEVDRELAAAGAPDNDPRRMGRGVGLGMAAPAIRDHGTREQRRRWLRPLWTGEEIWCQLFSEPDAGSDLASVRTSAVRDAHGWTVTGTKIWTSMAHRSRWGILLARSDEDAPKHQGMTYFVVDMTAPGIEVLPLRQITGEAEFSEVRLDGVRVPDEHRLGEAGQGWRVAQTTLMNERVGVGPDVPPRESGALGPLCEMWRERPEIRSEAEHDRLMRLWVDAEAVRLMGARLRQQIAAGRPGPEGSADKLAHADLNQAASRLEMDLLGAEALRYEGWSTGYWETDRPTEVDYFGRSGAYRFLRAKGNSIEGGSSEILRNIIAERVLGLPRTPAAPAVQARGGDRR